MNKKCYLRNVRKLRVNVVRKLYSRWIRVPLVWYNNVIKKHWNILSNEQQNLYISTFNSLWRCEKYFKTNFSFGTIVSNRVVCFKNQRADQIKQCFRQLFLYSECLMCHWWIRIIYRYLKLTAAIANKRTGHVLWKLYLLNRFVTRNIPLIHSHMCSKYKHVVRRK